MKKARPKRRPQAAFEENLFYEKLLTMQQADPRTFETLSIPTRLALNAYTAAKRQHEMLNEEGKGMSCRRRQ